VGTKSNRDGLGAVVRVTSASGKQWTLVRTGSSYCSQSETAPTFGLGQDKVVQALEVEWPSGAKQRFTGLPANQVLTVDEAKGIVPSVAKAAK
jgi:YD repeat-containing protein